MSSTAKKRKASSSAAATDDAELRPDKAQKAKENGSSEELPKLDYSPLTLPQIQSRIKALCHRVPTVPASGLPPDNQEVTKTWAMQMQASIEEFNLLLCTISAATYRWGTDRSGAADQNLGLLSGEISTAQDTLSASVTPRLTNVLAPVVDLVIEKAVTTTTKNAETGQEEIVKKNIFSREQNDTDFVRLCHVILSRNAFMMRQVVIANFLKVEKCIEDYVKACEKDRSHDSRGFAY